VALNSLSYLHDGDLKKVSKDKKLLKQAISVMDEGKHKQGVYYGLKIIHKLPFMKLVDGSFSEIVALFDSFDKLKQQANIATPHWDQLEEQAISKFNANNL